MVNEAHARWRDRSLRDIIARMRHDGCGGSQPGSRCGGGANVWLDLTCLCSRAALFVVHRVRR